MKEEISFSYSLIVMIEMEEEKQISSLPNAIVSFLMKKTEEDEISCFSLSIATSFIVTKEEEKEETKVMFDNFSEAVSGVFVF